MTTRISDKVADALEDIIADCRDASDDWEELLAIARRRHDEQLSLLVALMRHYIADIERLAREARRGEYNGDRDRAKKKGMKDGSSE